MKRRLIGPTVITSVRTGLVADSLYFGESPQSDVNVLAKSVLVFGAILSLPLTQ
jgi:hypothetical protein